MRDGRALRCLWGTRWLITVGKKHRYESGDGLEIYLSGVLLITVTEGDRCERREGTEVSLGHMWAHNGGKVVPL